jgi:hypothetical protein
MKINKTNDPTNIKIAQLLHTFAIGGVPCSADTFVVAKSFVLRINISGKNPAHRQSALTLAVSVGQTTYKPTIKTVIIRQQEQLYH